jgi:phosphoribosylformimino-5-aminoimidazole carboxamide ribotide isomerase
VHAVAGNREHYRPLVSRWHQSAEPVAVANAMRQQFGFEELYLADLDAILGRPSNLALYAELQALGFRLWVDAGIRTAEDAVRLADSLQSDGANALQSNQSSGVNETPLSACNDLAAPGNVESGGVLVVGLETIADATELARIVRHLGPELVAFSLDLKNGRPLGSWSGSPIDIANEAITAGVRRLIVLDLARVGVGNGLGTEQLLTELSSQHSGVELIAGGGVRGRADLERLRECGASAVLVGTALHNGNLP